MSVYEEIINGTYKKRNQTVYESIVNGTYKKRSQTSENYSNTNTAKTRFNTITNNKKSEPILSANGNTIGQRRNVDAREVAKAMNEDLPQLVTNITDPSSWINKTLSKDNRSHTIEEKANDNINSFDNIKRAAVAKEQLKENASIKEEPSINDILSPVENKQKLNILNHKSIDKNGNDISDRYLTIEQKAKKARQVLPSAVKNFGIGAAGVLPSIQNYGNAIGKVAYQGLVNKGIVDYNADNIVYQREKYLENKNTERTQEIQKNIDKVLTYDNVGKKLVELAPSIGENTVSMAIRQVNPALGTASFMLSAAGNYVDDGKKRGLTDEQIVGYATIMGIAEGASESLVSAQMLSTATKALTGTELSKATLKSLGMDITENFFQEAIMEPIQQATAQAFGGEKAANWENIWQRMLESGLDGIWSALLLEGMAVGITSSASIVEKVNNGISPSLQEYTEAFQDIKNSNKINIKDIVEGAIKGQVQQIEKQTANSQQNQVNNPTNIQTQQIIRQENKTAQNQTSNKLDGMLNNKNLPMQNYQYVKSENAKIDSLRQDASKYFNNTEQAHNFVNMLEKIVTDKDIDIRLDSNLKTLDGRIANGSYSNGVITINPNSSRAGEFIAVHELTHAIGTEKMINMIQNYRKSNAEFNSVVENILQNYKSTEMNEEALADVSGQLFGTQEFINNIAQNSPNIFQNIYSEIKYLWHQFRGYKNQNQFVEDLYYKWTQAYNSKNKLNYNSNYSIQTDNNGNKYVQVDTDQHIFDGVDKKDYNKIAKMYMQDYLMGSTVLSNTDNAVIDRKSANKYTNPGKRQDYFNEKMKLTPELKNVLEIAKKDSISAPMKDTSKYQNWEYYKFNFELGGKNFEGTINIGIDKDGNKHFYEINKIHFTGISSVSTNRQHKTDFINNSIAPTKNDVNTNTKYSMQESKNNSQLSEKISTWQTYLEKNFNTEGTRTSLKDIKLPSKKDLKQQYEVDTFSNTKNYFDNNFKMPTTEYFENKKLQELLTDEDYDVLDKMYEKEGKTEILTEKKKASILEKYINDKFTMKDSLDTLAQKIINKGHYVDKLAEKTNNPELKFMYDRNLNSFAEGQYVIGVAQTNNKGEQIGKSINEIWEPIENSNLTKEFSEYLLHKHNIDRSQRSKYVFGKEIGPTESTAIALDLENKHPEFKRWAKEIKNFNHNNLLNMKEAGLITEDTIKYIETMYPNYITIARDNENSTYTGKNDKTGTLAPLKKATGGNADIQPLKDTMAQQAIRIKRLINQNKLGQELAKSLKDAKVIEKNSETTYAPSLLMELETLVDTDSKGNKYYTYFEDGVLQKLKINDNLYESLKPTEISKLEKTLPLKLVQKVTSIHRSLLTSSNPIFVVTNFFKDFQDGAFNSKYSSKFVKNYGKALNEIYTRGKYYESYMANGGMNNSYFDYNEGIKKKPNKFVEKIRNANEIVEQLPRLAEFISTLEDGKSLNEALYNAAEITTNFKRGGDLTKAINRNGVNFLNASIQGLDKQWRNFSGQNGAKGYANLLLKATIMGVVPAILNHMLLRDDEDYQDLPESTKDLYYLFKYNDGKFIRIPKGRVLSIFGAAARRTLETVEGQEDSWNGFGETVINQVAPNNPLEDNIIAPIIQVKNNKTWYGSDLVSSRLQEELPKNQYDETTDNFSKWLGDKLNVSPKKINYLIDQYSGGIGDVILPMITPQAKQNVFVDKFTTDSVLKNKNISKFYEILEKQTQIANDSFATDGDEAVLKYLNGVSKEMSSLYKEKRKIQMSDISNKEKTAKVREIQEQINKLAEEGLNNYKNNSQAENYSKVGNEEYYKNSDGEWTTLTESEKEKNKEISIEIYSDYKQKLYSKKQEKIDKGEMTKKQDLKDADKIQILLDSNYSDKEKSAIYENYIKSEKDTQYDVMKVAGINITEYLKYKTQTFESDKKDDGTIGGKTVNKSKQKKVTEYLNSMKITGNQRLLLYALQGYTTTSSQKTKLANYVNGLSLSNEEKLKVYDKFSGFTVYKNGKIEW